MNQLTQSEIAEVEKRLKMFKSMSPKQRTFAPGSMQKNLEDHILASRCNDKEMNQLFDNFMMNSVSKEKESTLRMHNKFCSGCRAAFWKLVWLKTDNGSFD
ncbi:hypothetical protein ACFL1U_00795 [Patescibacteria group bacterium]